MEQNIYYKYFFTETVYNKDLIFEHILPLFLGMRCVQGFRYHTLPSEWLSLEMPEYCMTYDLK